ncbi:MAG: hypothetical protein WCC84_00705 [Candidatus Cybelea sp.]
MSGLLVAALVVVGAVAFEILLPGQAVYHAGWYNVALAAVVTVALIAGRRHFRRANSPRARIAVAAVALGAAVAGFAGIASGLLAPDNQTVIGAPGERVAVESLGVLAFPPASSDARASGSVTLVRRLGGPMAIGERARDAGSFILRTISRSVAYVEARDLRGNRLTVTQPEGAAFLSPVLLLEHRQTIAGIDLPFDSFNVPAARRVVKAVMFTPAQAAMLLHGGADAGEPAVLFAVDDENERPLPHAIALSAGGRAARAGGLSLRAVVAGYPAVEVVAAPNLVAAVFGTLLVIAGVIGLLTGNDRANVSQHDAALRQLDTLGR